MAKFIKSIFNPDKRKSSRVDSEADPEPEVIVPIDDRRKLSMSRSGRLKHLYKKRHSLSLELYGGEEMQHAEKPKSVEYHVHTTPRPSSAHETQRKLSTNVKTSPQTSNSKLDSVPISPEDEIDSAFEIIDIIDKS